MDESMRGAVSEPAAPVRERETDLTGADTASGAAPDTTPQATPDMPSDRPAGAQVAPLGVARTPTGNAEVDARLDRLQDADHLSADGHIEVYDDVHQGLRDTLSALDSRPAPPGPSTSHENGS